MGPVKLRRICRKRVKRLVDPMDLPLENLRRNGAGAADEGSQNEAQLQGLADLRGKPYFLPGISPALRGLTSMTVSGLIIRRYAR